MVGIPYVGSGPLAHSLALDKVVAKVIFQQNGIPTPDFAVLQNPGFEMPDLSFPLIVKPKNEAVSMGIRIVNNEAELKEAADKIFDLFRQPVLVEQYIEGREINVGLLGNNPPEVFVPAEIIFDEVGPRIYTMEDKKRTSGRTVGVQCPADLSPELKAKAQEIALRAFEVLECFDCARVDMRLDADGNFYILEINSLPSLGEHGSYVEAARYMGLDFPALVNRLVDVASARYFGMTEPAQLKPGKKDSETFMFNYLVERRDRMEKRVQTWSTLSSRTTDPVGINMAVNKLQPTMTELGMKQKSQHTVSPHVYVWETKAGMSEGTLLMLHLDVPLNPVVSAAPFSTDPEWLYGEGIGMSRAPLISMIYALHALRSARVLHKIPLGVLVYNDEGIDCRYSSEKIRESAEEARQVLVLRPGNVGDHIITQRRGQRLYRLTGEKSRSCSMGLCKA
jgi:D-alanine-D-alanine ligase